MPRWLKMPFAKPQENFYYHHHFLIFAVPEDRYGHHTILVPHKPRNSYRKVVAVFRRMEEEIANAELLGEIRMKKPYQWDEMEHSAKVAGVKTWSLTPECGRGLYEKLREQRQSLNGDDVISVAVYLAEVQTNRPDLLFDGQEASLPSGYLTYYTAR
ncbi:hypothetical protein C8R43DRAFT_264038 [Mycena crocata]|nr:hypothetical protein C8R43DRAFT_264038 [Mycena crocata]